MKYCGLFGIVLGKEMEGLAYSGLDVFYLGCLSFVFFLVVAQMALIGASAWKN